MSIYYIGFISAVFFLYCANCNISYGKYTSITKVVFVFLSMMPLVILATFRDTSVGKDVAIYIKPLFELACWRDSYVDFMKVQSYEIIYATITYIVSTISHNINVLFGVFEIVMLIPTYYFIWHYKKYVSVPIVLLSFCFLFYAYTYNTVRQYMAMAMVMIAYTFLEHREYFKSYIFLILAIGFHTSAFVCLIIPLLHWLITGRKSFKYKRGLISLLTILVYVIAINYNVIFRIVGTYLTFIPRRYLSNMYMISGKMDLPYANIVVAGIAIIVSIIVCYKEKRDSDMWMLFMCLIAFSGNVIAIYATFVQRIMWYFQIYYIVAMGRGSCVLKNSSAKKYIYDSWIIVVCFMYWIYTYVLGHAAEIYPYKFI